MDESQEKILVQNSDMVPEGTGNISTATELRWKEFLVALFKDLGLAEYTDEELKAVLTPSQIEGYTSALAGLGKWLQEEGSGPLDLARYKQGAPVEVQKALNNVSCVVRYRRARTEAFNEIQPPIEAAARCLDPIEQDAFEESISGALDAYMARDKSLEAMMQGAWMATPSAQLYTYWVGVIKKRQTAGLVARQAYKEAEKRSLGIKETIREVQKKLRGMKKPSLTVPKAIANHEPSSWCHLTAPGEEEVSVWVQAEIGKWLPDGLKEVVGCGFSVESAIIVEPIYDNFDGIPSIEWNFSALLLAQVELEVDNSAVLKRIGIPAMVPAEKNLGTMYLGPYECECEESLLTPMALLELLIGEVKEASGISIVKREGNVTTYDIPAMHDEYVDIHDDFTEFLREVCDGEGVSDGLFKAGLIDGSTAAIIKTKEGLSLPKVVGEGTPPKKNDDLAEVQDKLLGMGYPEDAVEKALATTHFTSEMTTQEKVAAAVASMQ